jgi:tetratricopeptide (TPR) repeat protein
MHLLSLVLVLAQDPAPEATHPRFTEQDLLTMVAELLPVVPECEHYLYPVEIRLKEEAVINAWTFVIERDGALIPQLELFRGLCNLAGNDPRLIRAVIAHELAHLAHGHSLSGFVQADLSNAHTRQQERQADLSAADYLVAIGYEREDVVDMLLMLDRHNKVEKVPWLDSVTSDHASCVTRAAAVSTDEVLLRAVTRFELGLAYMECRRYAAAIDFFDQAIALEPNLDEAYLNAASAALQNYYDSLPGAVQDEWLRPEFGPHLTDTVLIGIRGFVVSDEDLARYAQAVARIEKIPAGWYPSMTRFLLATAQVLHPHGDEKTLRAGVATLESLLADEPELDLWEVDRRRLSFANNLALGLQRLGEGERGARALVQEQRADLYMLPSAAENLARLPLTSLSKEDAGLALGVLQVFLKFTASDAPGAAEAKRAARAIAQKHGFQDVSAEPPLPISLCGVVSLTIDGKEIGLFQEFTEVTPIFGDLPEAGTISESFGDFIFLMWNGAEVMALSEGKSLVKLTSYRPGSFFELRPQRETGLQTSYKVSVGLGEADFWNLLAPAGGREQLGGRSLALFSASSFLDANGQPQEEEVWTYFPTLNFGVLLEEGQVKGISVTPVVVP